MKLQPGVGYTFDSSSHGFTLDTSDPFPSVAVAPTTNPFKIINVALRTSGGATTVTYQVQSGTINNLVPKIDDYVSGTEVKLDRVTAGVANSITTPTTFTVNQNVSGSLWADRIKINGMTARYYYARI
jgi:hypothetical protein